MKEGENMIERYSLKEMKNLWSDETRFRHFLDVEIASCYAFMKKGIIPEEAYQKIAQHATFSLERIYEIERTTKHDVIAFTTAVCETLGEESKYIHYGLTSTDVVDTALGVTFKKVNHILEKDISTLLGTLEKLALRYSSTPIIGRTHGMHAEVTSFGLKFALWYDELKRNQQRFQKASKDVEVGKLSGAVGNYITTTPEIETIVCEKLGLLPVDISTQVISRDRHAYYMMVLALIASFLEKIATEIRHLSRTEIGEVSEAFGNGQKGSSAMPHKKNPISCENICGCSRVMKSYVSVALENNPLWHERDISHSSSERIIFSDGTILLDYMLNRMNCILLGLIVNEQKMLENIELTHGVVYSGWLLNALVLNNVDRNVAYSLIQPLAFQALDTKTDFFKLVKESEIMKYLSLEELQRCFSLQQAFTHVKDIYQKLGIGGIKND